MGRFRPYVPVSPPEGCTYIGPCRYGFGPEAFCQDKSGRIVHASQVFRTGISPIPTKRDFEGEVGRLKEEKVELEERMRELVEHLKGKERKS
jgi:hypothetical protein